MARTTDTGRTLHDDEYLTTRQLAELLCLSIRTIETWRRTGGGPPYARISARCLRYRRSAIERWAAEHERHSTSDPGPEAAA